MANEKKVKTKTKEVVEINKKEINNYIDSQVKKYFSEEIEKSHRKIINYKNRKIFFKNIIIILLLVVILYLLHILYTLHYFGGVIKTTDNKVKVVEEQPIKKELSLDELKEKYSKYLDVIKIDASSEYLDGFYDGNLTSELKLYLALNNIDFKKITLEKDYNIIDDGIIKNEYNKIFVDDYKPNSFNYNGVSVKYISKMKSYITNNVLEKIESNIKRDIIDIKVNEKEVTITTLEGIIKDGFLYNRDDEKISYYNDSISLSDYEEELEKVEYVFVDKKLKEIK